MMTGTVRKGVNNIIDLLLLHFGRTFLERPEVTQYISTMLSGMVTGGGAMDGTDTKRIAEILLDDLDRWRATLIGQSLPQRNSPPPQRVVSRESVIAGRRERITAEDVENHALDNVQNAPELMNNLMMVFVLSKQHQHQRSNN